MSFGVNLSKFGLKKKYSSVNEMGEVMDI